jgi:hypothetical protein
MRELQSAVKRLDVILQSASDVRETVSRDEPATLPADRSLRHAIDEGNRAWQLGYECFASHDHAKGDTFLNILDGIPEQFHKAAFEGWTAAMSDHSAFRRE